MCDCDNNTTEEEILTLAHLKIYTDMAEYKVKSSWIGRSTHFNGQRKAVRWVSDMTQEKLAHIYEEVNNGENFIDKVDKIKKSNEKNSNKSSKKSNSSKENNEKE